jgi:hypothetical protein
VYVQLPVYIAGMKYGKALCLALLQSRILDYFPDPVLVLQPPRYGRSDSQSHGRHSGVTNKVTTALSVSFLFFASHLFPVVTGALASGFIAFFFAHIF